MNDLEKIKSGCKDLANANLRDADLSNANLSNANLRNADLRDADLSNANLRDADLSNANLSNANLRNADLRDADLRDADLSNADLRDADLSNANLSNANLRNADLSKANLIEIKKDIFRVLEGNKNEVEFLLRSLVQGNVDGSYYEGKCMCLIGTIAKAKKTTYHEIEHDPDSPSERFFLGIKEGDTPDNNAVSKIVVDWIREFLQENNESDRVSKI